MKTTYTSSTNSAQAMTLDLLDKVSDLIKSIPDEPLGKWMRDSGHPPEVWNLILPKSFQLEGPTIWPSYVMFSSLAENPLFLLRSATINNAFNGPNGV